LRHSLSLVYSVRLWQDIIEDGEIKLDWAFKLSLIYDLVKVSCGDIAANVSLSRNRVLRSFGRLLVVRRSRHSRLCLDTLFMTTLYRSVERYMSGTNIALLTVI